jgi:Ras family protein T1
LKKALIMREIDEESVSNLLGKGNALAACDVAAFVYDISDAVSWKRAVELLVQVAAHGETNGYEVPCLLIAAKDDLEPDPAIIQSSAQVPIPFIQWLFIGL